jgi:hypothetical protein
MTIAAAGSAVLFQEQFRFDPAEAAGWCIGHPT